MRIQVVWGDENWFKFMEMIDKNVPKFIPDSE